MVKLILLFISFSYIIPDRKKNMPRIRIQNRQPIDIFTCTSCNIEKSCLEFGKRTGGWKDLQGIEHKYFCRKCDYKKIAEDHVKKPYIRLFHLAKRRAEKKKIEFSLTKEIVKAKFPEDNICPVTKKPFLFGIENKNYNPSIDRIDNNKGYTKDNIVIVCHIVNAIKKDHIDFLIFKQIVDFYG